MTTWATLVDDGTLDTVWEILEKDNRTSYENRYTLRYSQELAAEYRDPETGELDERRFWKEVVKPDLGDIV